MLPRLLFHLHALLFNIFSNFYSEGICPEEKYRDLIIRLLRNNVELFRYNKLLVALAIMMQQCYSYTNDLLSQRIHRHTVYHKEIQRIFTAFKESDVNAVCFKTITYFPKDVADIDIILYSNEDLNVAESVLKSLGYKNRKKGLQEDLWSSVKEGIVVDVELHTDVSAAKYEYYPKKLLFIRSIEYNNVRVPSPIDSILILVPHCVMKDLYITLADLLDITITMKKNDIPPEHILGEADRIGIKLPLLLVLHLIQILSGHVTLSKSIIFKPLVATRVQDAPLRPGLHTVALAYTLLTVNKLRREPLEKVIYEVSSLPRGKGIDGLVRYISGLKPPIKRLDK